MRDEIKKLQLLTRRAFIIGLCQTALLMLIFLRYFYLQIIDGIKYRTLSDKNRLRLSIIAAPRGIVTDRYNEDIITNSLDYKVVFESTEVHDIKKVLSTLKELLPDKIDATQEELTSRINKLQAGSSLTIAEVLSWEEIAKIELHTNVLPGVSVITSQKRVYNLKEQCAHITGYIGSPTQQETKRLGISASSDFYIGKSGIEKKLDEALRGVPGVKKTEVDAFGHYIRVISSTEPIQGETIALSIDRGLQHSISELFGSKAGAAVVLKVETGEILSLYSNPSFDPNLFVGGISMQAWQRLGKDPTTPLINKAISAQYPPGSTFKLVTGLAALEHGIPEHLKVFCNGSYKVGNRIFHCMRKEGHGHVDLRLAIAQSCNVYFYVMAEKIGINNIAHAAKILGFGSKTKVELPYEKKGHIPEMGWKLLTFNKKWVMGDTINASIGQGFVLSTIIQLAQMTARVASGRAIQPTILLGGNDAIMPRALRVGQQHLEAVREGMFMACNDHRGNMYRYCSGIPEFEMSGKTGTAQVISLRKVLNKRFEDHGLFVGFAPFSKPKYAVASIVEHGSWGALSALPIAINIFSWLKKNDPT